MKMWTLADKETGKFIIDYFGGTPLIFKTKKEAGYEKRDHEKAVKVEIKVIY